jgi:hypothetical protein
MRVVTTVHKAGFDVYGHRWVESIKNWTKAEFVMYAEGFTTPDVRCVRTEDVPRLQTFKDKHKAYAAPSWRHDIVRFSNKVFAAYDALYDYDGIGVWLDADCVTYQPIPEGYIEEQLGDAYVAHFARPGHYTETGMWIVDCRHPAHKAFLDTWIGWFETGAFTQLEEWHDCTTLDATLRLMRHDITTRDLSGDFGGKMHPMAYADISRYVDHCKGPRKGLGVSPENTRRSA